MADLFSISIKNLDRKLNQIADTNTVATYRTLNTVGRRVRKELVDEMAGYYGIKPKKLIGSKVTFKPATKRRQVLTFTGRSSRMNMILPATPVQYKKGGIAVYGIGRKRYKLTGRIRPGSTKAFLINAKAGGQTGGANIQATGGNLKKVPVYRKGSQKKKVTTLKGSSVAHMMRTVGIGQKRVENRIVTLYGPEYRKQIEKAKYR